MIKLIDIDERNWIDVLFMTTNENGMPTLCEEFVASNALSIVQSFYEKTWTIKAIENEDKLIGFAMYGFCKEKNFYELCRIMIDRKYQGHGYGTKAIEIVLREMKKINRCKEVFLSTDPENEYGKHIYRKIGFKDTGELVDGEELFRFEF
ncbi:GNAT family N-acetyltransferase [Tissierella sp. MSJ-40]|uniref:GNAT family N-acetyltransferase n=1 Tax=Tissierella simiarum TaxID=2841534 RepID=A0ABS6EA65_9FIRM|nr:GNAT family N-acetyltransferase [Tissierella simiarum]MBU5439820.1 GNAT family N-acetyltransferase [Tissierella simiarum]